MLPKTKRRKLKRVTKLGANERNTLVNKGLFKMLQPFLPLSLLCFTKRPSACRVESLQRPGPSSL